MTPRNYTAGQIIGILREAVHRREERCDLLPHQQPKRPRLRLNDGP